MELKQNLRLTQTVTMTPQLQQAISLLQLSRIELRETIREEMETTPSSSSPTRLSTVPSTRRPSGKSASLRRTPLRW